MTVYLVGFMASGKTTLGQAVARACGVSFTDLDQYIEQSAGKTVKEIFASEGEDAFRQLESVSLRRLAMETQNDVAHRIIACGGGTPCMPANMALMNATGVTVWLDAPADRIAERLILYPGDRPLIAGKTGKVLEEYIESKLAERRPHYAQAQVRFDSSSLDTPEEIERTTTLFITQILNSEKHA